MKYVKKIVGNSVYLSPLSADDCEAFTRWVSDKEVAENLGMYFMPVSNDSEREWLSGCVNKHIYSIVKLDGDELIGNIGLENIHDVHRSAHVGLFIGEDENRSKGYGAEALRLMVGYAFNTLNLHSVELDVYDFNVRAISCYKKVGFKEAGRRREAYFSRGEYHDIIKMDILKNELR